MSNESDKALFDGHMSEIERLRATSAGAEILEVIESSLEALGGELLLATRETGAVLGPLAIAALKSFAVGLATAQIEKLGGKRS